MQSKTDFVGRGIRFPLEVDHTGSIGWAGGSDATDGAILMIVSTAPGERVMRPEFGCAIWDLLFAPINPSTLGLMAQAVRDAVARWEPRVDVEAVTVRPNPVEQGQVLIDILYKRRDTNDRRNLVFPFYVIPEE